MSQAHGKGHYRDLIPPEKWKVLEEGMEQVREAHRKMEETLISKLATVTNPEVKDGLQKLLRQTRKFLRGTSR